MGSGFRLIRLKGSNVELRLDVFVKPPLHHSLCVGALFAERQDNGAYIVRRLGVRDIVGRQHVGMPRG
jgi:hypothetical protein